MMRRPFGLDALVKTSQGILVELLGVEVAPPVEVFAGRRYREGHRVDAGRRLARRELATELVGDHISGPLHRRSTLHFEFDIPSTGDCARLMVIDRSEDVTEPVSGVFSPTRTCVGVVVATALALAAAVQGAGEFIDDEIKMLRPPVTDPRRVIERTRLPGRETDFAGRCERYLRQYPQLDGWPPDISLAT